MTDGTNAADPVGRSAAQQGSNIPAKWRPTVAEPVPVVRCTAIKKDGNRCKNWSLRGAHVCLKHGGRLPNIKDHAEAVVEAARMRLIGLSDLAIDQLEDLVQNASAEKIRLDAAKDILDRNGVKGAMEINVEVQHTESAADRLASRLAEAAERLTSKKIEPVVTADPDTDTDEDIVDAELDSEE